LPVDEKKGGSRSTGLLAVQSPDAASSPREFSEFNRSDSFTFYYILLYFASALLLWVDVAPKYTRMYSNMADIPAN
jgi:hypothetical protein